jgi:hypothetical protein
VDLHGLVRHLLFIAEKKHYTGGKIEVKMTVSQKTNWAKIGVILGIIASAYGIITHVYSDIQANKQAIIKQATDEATRQADRNAYRLKMENRFEDIEKRITVLENKKNH